MSSFSSEDIKRYFELLNEELKNEGIGGRVYVVGGAVMCLVFGARESTKDVDAYFKPASAVREAAARVAAKTSINEDWLNDAVKGFLSENGSYSAFLNLSNLTVMCAQPEYLLAMKCLSMRIGEESHDEDDIRYLLRHLNLTNYQSVLEIITTYYPLERFPQKALYALEELLEARS